MKTLQKIKNSEKDECIDCKFHPRHYNGVIDKHYCQHPYAGIRPEIPHYVGKRCSDFYICKTKD
jgi:hypothetical protein